MKKQAPRHFLAKAIFLSAFVVLASSCLVLDGSFRDRELTSFGFSIPANPGLRMARVSQVLDDSKEILVTLPDYLDLTSLAPDFAFKGVKVLVGGKEQASGTTRNDFARPLVYSVLGIDDETTDYRVTVRVVPPSEKKDFEIPYVIALSQEQNFIESYGRLESTTSYNFPYSQHFDLSRMAIIYSTTGAKVTANGEDLKTPDSRLLFNLAYFTYHGGLAALVDFAEPVDFEVTAEDGSIAHYVYTITCKPKLYYFYFLKSRNIGLMKDCYGTIDETTGIVSVKVPSTIDRTRLVAEYSYQGEGVSVGGAVQTNGVSANDFSGEVEYLILGNNGRDSKYRVQITPIPPSMDKALISITIGSIHEYSNGSFYWLHSTNDLDHVFPSNSANLPLYHLYVQPKISGVRISVADSGTPRELSAESGSSQICQSNYVDFSSPVAFTITAEDGSTATYVAHITKGI